MSFDQLGLSEPICRALIAEGYKVPTEIQSLAIPSILEGKDLLASARTGTGKTAAFALPVLERLLIAERQRRRRPIRALVLSPTRELAQQTAGNFSSYGRHTGLRQVVIVGGVRQGSQTQSLRQGVDIVVATPGRLLDLVEQGFVDLSEVSMLVLDEADQMLDMGFGPDIRRILALLPVDRQTLFFSATLPTPIVRMAHSMMKDFAEIRLNDEESSERLITQTVYRVRQQHKVDLLKHVLTTQKMTRTLIFTRTKRGADEVVRQLREANFHAEAIHSDKTQSARQRILANFRANKTQILVATDIAARGIDVDAISHVLNYDVPEQPETYVHRIGRTGRAGCHGMAVSFCDPRERGFIHAIELHLEQRIEVIENLPVNLKPSTPIAGPESSRGHLPVEQERSRPPRHQGEGGPRPFQRGARSGGSKPWMAQKKGKRRFSRPPAN